MVLSSHQYEVIRRKVRAELGIELGPDRKAMVSRRLGGIPEGPQLVSSMMAGDLAPPSLALLADVLTTNHTHWGRESAHFDVLIQWIDEQPASRALRIWCAASSTGEEPYTLWMACQDTERSGRGISLLATDISRPVLEHARKGIYEAEATTRLSAKWQRHFRPLPDGLVTVPEAAKRAILFRRLNLVTNPLPFRNQFDVIFCRNVLIYFDGDLRRQIIQRVVDQLRPGGLLCIGLAESLPKEVTGLSRLSPSAFLRSP